MFLYIMCAFKNRTFPVWLFLRGKHYNQGLKSFTLVQTLASWFPSMLHCGGHINILMVTGPRNWPIYSDWCHALPTSDTNAGRVDLVPFSNIEATYIIQSCVADSQVFNTDKVSHKHDFYVWFLDGFPFQYQIDPVILKSLKVLTPRVGCWNINMALKFGPILERWQSSTKHWSRAFHT